MESREIDNNQRMEIMKKHMTKTEREDCFEMFFDYQKAMQEYSDQQNKYLLDEIETYRKEIDGLAKSHEVIGDLLVNCQAENESLQSRISELEKANENLLMKPSNSEIMLWENEEHLRTLKISFLKLLKRITYTEEEKEKYFEVECDCGFKGLSFLLLGGGQIADTGDYGDCYCPCCNEIID